MDNLTKREELHALVDALDECHLADAWIYLEFLTHGEYRHDLDKKPSGEKHYLTTAPQDI